jgi:tripartite-type tricarboxylate transporter receptor subunit TctC
MQKNTLSFRHSFFHYGILKMLRMLAVVFAVSSFQWVDAVMAQAPYPAKSVRVVIPYPPGGGNDIIGRIVADDLGKRLGQQMLVDNRPGGSTAIGAEIVARAPADGYTLLITSHTTYALLPNLRPKLNYDPIRDFEPVSLLAKQSFALAVHPSLPASTVKQVIALAKARPGQLTFSSAGAGTGTHFSGEQGRQHGTECRAQRRNNNDFRQPVSPLSIHQCQKAAGHRRHQRQTLTTGSQNSDDRGKRFARL